MKYLRSLIYALKRVVHKTPMLYGPLFSVLTLNAERVKRFAHRKLFPSAFGGMWTDRADFASLLKDRRLRGEVSDANAKLLEQWNKNGFVVLEGAIDAVRIDELRAAFARLPISHPEHLKITGGGHLESRRYDPQLIRPHDSIRIVDFYFFSPVARSILFDRSITDFLKLVFEAEPLLTQSLSFEHGSEQEIHQDTAFVIMNSPLKFAASWIALEDIQAGSGELMYYPGSHHWNDYLFSGRFKHWDRERDGDEQLKNWYAWMHAEAARRGVRKEIFRPKKGDLLIWHGGLAHGGAPIQNSALTRRSLVGHYCSSEVRPLYHYYKPAHRKIYRDEAGSFTSSHYLPGQQSERSS